MPPPSSGNLWLCFAWEGLATVGQFPRIKQEREWWDVDGRKANSCRKIFLKVVAARALQLLEWLHGAGYAHRSIGPSSLLLSSYDQYQPKKLALRAVDLGFCASASMLSDDEVASAMRRGASSPLAVLPQEGAHLGPAVWARRQLRRGHVEPRAVGHGVVPRLFRIGRRAAPSARAIHLAVSVPRDDDLQRAHRFDLERARRHRVLPLL